MDSLLIIIPIAALAICLFLWWRQEPEDNISLSASLDKNSGAEDIYKK